MTGKQASCVLLCTICLILFISCNNLVSTTAMASTTIAQTDTPTESGPIGKRVYEEISTITDDEQHTFKVDMSFSFYYSDSPPPTDEATGTPVAHSTKKKVYTLADVIPVPVAYINRLKIEALDVTINGAGEKKKISIHGSYLNGRDFIYGYADGDVILSGVLKIYYSRGNLSKIYGDISGTILLKKPFDGINAGEYKWKYNYDPLPTMPTITINVPTNIPALPMPPRPTFEVRIP